MLFPLEKVEKKRSMVVLLSCELVLLECRHESCGKSEGSQTHCALRTSANIMNQRNCLLVQLLLVEELVFDQTRVDEVAHIRACIPSHVIGVHVNLSQILDHLVGVCYVCLGSWCCCCKIRGGHVVVGVRIRGCDICRGEGERVGDFESRIYIHSNNRSRCCGWERCSASLNNLHHHLLLVSLGASWGLESHVPGLRPGRS